MGDDPERLLLFIYAKDIFQGQRLKIELVGSVIVCRDGFRIAVYDDCLKSQLFERQCCMYAAVVDLDALPDPVGAAAENHDFWLICADRVLIFGIVG